MRSRKMPRYEIQVDVQALLMLVVTVAMVLMFALGAFLFFRSQLKIKNFEIRGVTTYEYTDIVNASSLKKGDRLYGIDSKEIEKKILEECPYLESVKVTKEFPSTVCFSVEERKAAWFIDIAGDYYVLDSNLYVMTEHSSKERLAAQGVTELVLPNIKSAMKGELPEFGADEQEIIKTLELISMVRTTTFKSRITKLDLASRFDIYITVDGVYEVYMKDSTNFEAKLDEVQKIVNSDKLKDYAGGEIDASDPSAVYFKPSK